VTDSEILLIDYKTNRPPPKSVADVDITYLRQLAGYHAILQEIYPEKSIYCALLWTMDANLMAIDGAILKAYAP